MNPSEIVAVRNSVVVAVLEKKQKEFKKRRKIMEDASRRLYPYPAVFCHVVGDYFGSALEIFGAIFVAVFSVARIRGKSYFVGFFPVLSRYEERPAESLRVAFVIFDATRGSLAYALQTGHVQIRHVN